MPSSHPDPRADPSRDDLDTLTRDAGLVAASPSPVTPLGPSTTDDVLDLDEARRTLIFGGFLIGLIVVVAGSMQLLGGDPFARSLHVAGLAMVAATALWFVRVARDPASYRPWHSVVFGHACVVAITTGFYYWGPFSAALLIIPFGAFIFSGNRNLGGALSVTVHGVLAHAAISAMFLTGVLDDRSLVSASHLPRSSQVVLVALIDGIFLAAFVVARKLRASSRSAIEQLDRALRVLGQREAQLAEARRDLRDAVLGGGRGRFSNHVVGGFRLGTLRGRGGMGEVYEARRDDGSTPDERYAVKLLHPHLLADPAAYERFAREARSAAALDSSNVVRVVEVSPDHAALPYLAMELLEGNDLATILRERPTLPVAEVVTLIRQIGSGLEAAHTAGIVHRDLKPQNVFAARTGPADDDVTWKILDFGVSKLVSGDGSLTIGHAIGTPSYMSPEQARGDVIDHRSDLYSLGVIAYRALTGRPVVAAAEVMTMLHDVCHRMPPQPSAVGDLAPALDDVLLVALAKDPGARFASARELADTLAAAAAGQTPVAVQVRATALLRSWSWARPQARE